MRDVPTCRQLLPPRAKALLDGRDRRPTSHGTLLSIANHCAHLGLTEGEYSVLVIGSAFWAEFKPGDDDRKRHRRLASAWSTAQDGLEDGPNVRELLSALRDRVAAADWTGRTGSRDRTVALALLGKLIEVGAYTYLFGTRELAKVTPGISQPSVVRALGSLAECGLVRKTWRPDYGRGPVATAWVVDLAWTRSPSPRNVQRESGCTPGKSFPDSSHPLYHDAFTRGALGLTTGRVWYGLPRDRVFPRSEIARLTGLKPDTAGKALRTLADHRLVEKTGRGQYRALDASAEALDAIAESFGKLGYSARKAEQYTAEQRENREYRARADALVPPPDPGPHLDPFDPESPWPEPPARDLPAGADPFVPNGPVVQTARSNSVLRVGAVVVE